MQRTKLLQGGRLAQLRLFDPANVFERVEEHLDTPTARR
jgi:hypothetical protein